MIPAGFMMQKALKRLLVKPLLYKNELSMPELYQGIGIELYF